MSEREHTFFQGGYTIKDLEQWYRRIEALAKDMGLSYFPIDFEICDHDQMLGYITYSGMPSHFPHWSYGKSYERQRTLYDLGIIGLPYEMVINSNPCLAYLMKDNSLTLQVLTMAHVFAHDDFFKNNRYFAGTRPELTVERVKTRAGRVRDYIENPSIGPEKVERVLDAAQALQFVIDPNRMGGRKSSDDIKREMVRATYPDEDRFSDIRSRVEKEMPELAKVPLEPDPDLLLFIRDHHSELEEWERDLLTIVHEEACYFLPQMETKIMNEGWASFWHKRILDALELPAQMHMEFLVRHNQVVKPAVGGMNPYHLGITLFNKIFEDAGGEKGEGFERIFAVREEDRDASFLRRFMTEEIIRELDMFKHEKSGDARKITEIADPEGWEKVKNEMIRNVGANRLPVIKVEDADMAGDRTLKLKHYFDGRELDMENAERVVGYIYRLWGAKVVLESNLLGQPVKLQFDQDGFKTEN